MGKRQTQGLGPCPPWCQREHAPNDHPEDMRHQGDACHLELVLAVDSPPGPHARVVDTVAYADQPAGTGNTWIRVESTESPDIRVALTPDAARGLARALDRVISTLSGAV